MLCWKALSPGIHVGVSMYHRPKKKKTPFMAVAGPNTSQTKKHLQFRRIVVKKSALCNPDLWLISEYYFYPILLLSILHDCFSWAQCNLFFCLDANAGFPLASIFQQILELTGNNQNLLPHFVLENTFHFSGNISFIVAMFLTSQVH